MKIAVTGKGGTGKTTVTAAIATILSQRGFRVILIDADPDMNLQITLGLKGKITPLAEMKELIQERTETKNGEPAFVFKLNPKVDDIPEKYFLKQDNLLLGVMGTIRGGGLGCSCPENAFLKALLRHLILLRKEIVILDMEAGIEHLGRGTTAGIDWLLVTVEPGEKSIQTACRIELLASQLGIRKMGLIGNFIKNKEEESFLQQKLPHGKWLGFLPYEETIRQSEMNGSPFWKKAPCFLKAVEEVINKLGVTDGKE